MHPGPAPPSRKRAPPCLLAARGPVGQLTASGVAQKRPGGRGAGGAMGRLAVLTAGLLGAAALLVGATAEGAGAGGRGGGAGQPNIVFLLTDDQDEVLNSTDYMPALQRIMGGGGVKVEKMFATTPVCCPSRSSYMCVNPAAFRFPLHPVRPCLPVP